MGVLGLSAGLVVGEVSREVQEPAASQVCVGKHGWRWGRPSPEMGELPQAEARRWQRAPCPVWEGTG